MEETKRNDDVPLAEPLVEVKRGSLTESRHRGHVVAVDGGGVIVAHAGFHGTVTYLRSACKPHQAIPLITSGAADRFGFTEKELAVACGSHNGEREHVETVISMLRKIGLTPDDLKCGPHEPYGPEAAAELRAKGERPTSLHNNCSGKHAGMLALAVHLGAPIDTYLKPSNPVQLEIARVVSQFSGIPVEDIAVGIDGCGVPTFGVTVRAMALMSVRLMVMPASFGEHIREACRRLVAAITAYPEMVEGEGELDTSLMRTKKGTLVSKVGAEGVYMAGIAPSERWPHGLGVAFKMEDGDKKDRARPPVAIETLRQLDVLNDEDLRALSKFTGGTMTNHRGDEVGEVRASFVLKRPHSEASAAQI